jgi:hypothetical protein
MFRTAIVMMGSVHELAEWVATVDHRCVNNAAFVVDVVRTESTFRMFSSEIEVHRCQQ